MTATTDTRRLADAAAQAVAAAAEPFEGVDDADLAPLLARIGGARLVLLGEATHGTSEFYRFRARLTRALIEEKGFRFVAVEADWPDAARIDDHVRHADRPRRGDWRAFSRFPTWMWRNREVREMVDGLAEHNRRLPPERRVAFYGLDLYSLYTSIGAVLDYLDDTDPEAAAVARRRYGCLSPWEDDPATYGAAAVAGRIDDCEEEVVAMLADLVARGLGGAESDGDRFTDALGNARVVANAERYYKVMYRGGRESWNLRDQHMFDTLRLLLDVHGPGARAVVWAHNSHLGDARATEMGRRGEHNLGQLCRRAFGRDAHLVGFGTHAGTVAAASDWGAPMEIKRVRPSHPESWEHLSHRAGLPAFLLGLGGAEVREALARPRLERAIGVIYCPESELASHYFEADLPRQFDEWVWLDETSAVTPLAAAELAGVPETYPFGL
jgi:erythromycin esterase-like protein